MQTKTLVLCVLLFSPKAAFAVVSPAKKDTGKESAPLSFGKVSSGPFVLVEWNAADLINRRARLHSEYIAMDGLAFGFSTEFQDNKNRSDTWQQNVASVGVSATQYLQSLSLRGLFVRGETLLFRSRYRWSETERESNVPVMATHTGETWGLMMELGGGYRYSLTRLVTTSMGFGARRAVPDFFRTREGEGARLYASQEGVWELRLDLGIGIGF